MDLALERVEYCFSCIKLKGYQKEGQAYFYHLHSDQYSQFLYYLANSIWTLQGDSSVCDKLILLKRSLHGIWFSYKGSLPDVFLLCHPVGTVLGNAVYSDYMVVLQNVTVNTGAEKDGEVVPPHLGKGLFLSAGAKIIGREPIGDYVTIGVDTCVHDKKLENNTLIYRASDGRVVEKANHDPVAQKYFNIKI